jgi:polyphenol oxidase
MLQRLAHRNGVVTYRSPLLESVGVLHAFSTRIGGRSAGDFASLNLAQSSGGPSTESNEGDPAVESNYALLKEAIGVEGHTTVWCRQVHGCAAVVAEPANCGEHPEADAILTDQPRLLLSVRVADCVPILLASLDGKTVAAVHAGWRGVVAGVIHKAVEQLRVRQGVNPSELVAAIGPCIGAANFEVGTEVAEAFQRANLGHAVVTAGYPKPHIDLASACDTQLRLAGVPGASIDRTDRCTFRDADEFYSHRRDQGRTGRMAAVIAVAH